MGIVAKAGATFVPCPSGSHLAVCIDVVDLGLIATNFGGKTKTQHKVKIVWQVDEKREDGTPFHASKRYTLSLHEKASLRKDLESWRGRQFTEDELDGWDVENVLRAPAMISVVHEAKNGTVYGNVSAVMRPPKGVAVPAADPKYIRVKDRKDEAPGTASGSDGPDFDGQYSDEDIPF
jgi:hypothetical protein